MIVIREVNQPHKPLVGKVGALLVVAFVPKSDDESAFIVRTREKWFDLI